MALQALLSSPNWLWQDFKSLVKHCGTLWWLTAEAGALWSLLLMGI